MEKNTHQVSCLKELNQKEMTAVSGAVAPLVIPGGISAGLAVGNAAWSFGRGVYDAVKGKK